MFSRRTILSLFVLNILFGLGLTTYTISKRAHSSAMLNASIGDALMRNLPLVSADNFKPLPPSLAKILPQDNQSNHLSPRGIRLLKNGKAVGWFACTTGQDKSTWLIIVDAQITPEDISTFPIHSEIPGRNEFLHQCIGVEV